MIQTEWICKNCTKKFYAPVNQKRCTACKSPLITRITLTCKGKNTNNVLGVQPCRGGLVKEVERIVPSSAPKPRLCKLARTIKQEAK